MLLKLKSHLARRLAILAATIAVTCTFATLAAAQEQPPPKWELFGGYSVFDPGATIHGELPEALLPLSNRLEWNPRGAGAEKRHLQFRQMDRAHARHQHPLGKR